MFSGMFGGQRFYDMSGKGFLFECSHLGVSKLLISLILWVLLLIAIF